MRFIKAPAAQAVPRIAATIANELLQNKKVLWMVCGGSNIVTQVKVMNVLLSEATDYLHNLDILPMDERFGASGHADSNYLQMQTAGFIPGAASWTDILARDQPLDSTVAYYEECVKTAFAHADFVVGTFGMGADGHTAGVLPHSPALSSDNVAVVGYNAPGFIRMTITPQWLTRCDMSYVLAYGPEKVTALHNLQAHSLPLEEMPAGLHYDIPSATIYNDSIGEEVTQ